MTTAFCMPLHGSAGSFRPPLNEIVNHSGSACQRKHAELTMGEFLTYTYRANKHVLLAFGSDRTGSDDVEISQVEVSSCLN